jgi:hypothetical protein
MPEDPAVKEKQERLAAKLKWLVNRAKPDFKGNQPAFVAPKTLKSVAQAKKQEEAKLAGEADFRPFSHGKVPLGFIATKPAIYKGSGTHLRQDQTEGERDGAAELVVVTERTQRDENHPNHNSYHQRLDPETHKPEMYSALTWQDINLGNSTQHRSGKRLFHEKCGPTSTTTPPSEEVWRPQRKDVEGCSVQHRLQTIRKDALLHPKFTAQSRIAHAETHWDPMSQLLSHAFLVPPPRIERTALVPKPNKIRMVHIMRRTKSSPAAWK